MPRNNIFILERFQITAAFMVLAGLFAPYLNYAPFASAATGVPKVLNYQGRLYDQNGNLLGGAGTAYCFRFSIYDSPTVGGGSKLWPSGTPATVTSTVRNGLFSVGVGDTSIGGDALDFNFQDNDTTYLNVEVAPRPTSTCGTFENLSPRQRIFATGYAVNAGTVGGFTAAQQASSTQIPVLSSGNLILGGVNPQVNATGTNALVLQGGGGTGAIQFFGSSNFITSTGTLNIAGILQSANVNQFLTTTSTPTFAGLISTGVVSSTGLLFNNATGTGNLEVNTLVVTGTGTTTSGLSFINASGTALKLSGNLYFENASIISGTSSNIMTLQGFSTGNIQFFGASNFITSAGALTVASTVTASNVNQFLTTTSTPTFAGLNFTNATGTGNLQTGTFTATGQATLGSASSTNFQTSGSLVVSSTLTVQNGESSFQGISFTNATGTGNIALTGANAQINSSGTNTLTLQGGSGTGNIQFFSASNFITSAGALTVASTVTSLNINQFLNTTGTPTFANLTLTNLATGTVLFAGSADAIATSSNFFWDSATNHLGLGTNAPSSTLHVVGATQLQGFTFTNATGTALRLSGSTSTLLTLIQSSSSQFFAQFDNGSGIEQFRVDGNGLVFANGFIARQMQYSEEFLRTNAAVTNDTAGGGTTGLGDTFAWGVGATANGHVSVAPVADAINGMMQLQVTGGAGRAGLLYLSAGSANRNDILNATSSPVIVMKLRPSVVGTNNLIFAGMADFTDGVTTDPTNGIYFTNASGTTWTGVARSGGTQTSVTCTGQAVSTSTDAYFRIQVNSSSSVEFFMDNDTSNGINTTSCGRVTSTIPTTPMTAEIMNQIRTGGTSPSNINIDYVRLNQDDPIAPGGSQESGGAGAGADVAENIPALDAEFLEPGEVLVLVSTSSLTAARSAEAYASGLYGVVATDPGIILGHGGTSTVRVALAGRVPVKVTLENGPIAPGDWLTSATEPGQAMKATKAGMVLGRALEDFDGSTSTILATVEVQYYAGPNLVERMVVSVSDAVSALASAVAEGATKFTRFVMDELVAQVASIKNLFVSSVTVLPGGEVSLPAGQGELAGSAVLPVGLAEVFVSSPKVRADSHILLTPRVPVIGALAVTEKVAGQGFKVKLPGNATEDLAFDWIVLQTYGGTSAAAPSAPPPAAAPPPEASPPAEEAPPPATETPPPETGPTPQPEQTSSPEPTSEPQTNPTPEP